MPKDGLVSNRLAQIKEPKSGGPLDVSFLVGGKGGRMEAKNSAALLSAERKRVSEAADVAFLLDALRFFAVDESGAVPSSELKKAAESQLRGKREQHQLQQLFNAFDRFSVGGKLTLKNL